MVQAVDGFGVEVGSIVRGDEATPLGGVVPGVAVVQAGIIVVVVAAIADGVGLRHSNIGGFTGNGAVTPHLYSTMVYTHSQEKATQVKNLGGSVILIRIGWELLNSLAATARSICMI